MHLCAVLESEAGFSSLGRVYKRRRMGPLIEWPALTGVGPLARTLIRRRI
jgi:hypothetical protein